MTTSTRMMRLLGLLQRRRQWTGTELADRLDVSVRTLRRDVERLRELGYPVEADRGIDGGYRLAPGAALPPLSLDGEEAVALVVGLQSTAREGSPELADGAVRALGKVVQVLPGALRRRAEALLGATVAPTALGPPPAPLDIDALVVTAAACRDAERVTFGYRDAAGSTSDRHVEPHHLVPLRRRWYLLGFDLDRQDWRVFRLDRLDSPAVTGKPFRRRAVPGGDPAAYVSDSTSRNVGEVRMLARVHAPAADVHSRIGRWARIQPDGDQRCIVDMTSYSFDYPLMSLGSIGAEFDVLEPPQLRDLVAEWGARFRRSETRAAITDG